MEIDINIKSTDNSDNSTEYLQTGDYSESMMNDINSDRMFDEEAKLDEERKLQGFPLSPAFAEAATRRQAGTTNPKE